jgi:hypothetical protein
MNSDQEMLLDVYRNEKHHNENLYQDLQVGGAQKRIPLLMESYFDPVKRRRLAISNLQFYHYLI